MDTFSLADIIDPNIGGRAEKPVNQTEYTETLNSLTKSLKVINDSVNQMRNQIQQMNQLIVQSHNINSTLIRNLQTGIIRCIPRADMKIIVGLVEHCNLNCAGCDHFSPLAKPQFADFEEMERDFTRLAELFHDRPGVLSFQGGEPLLHPEIIKFMAMTRQKFPRARIYIITNGTKLLSMSDEFWNSCKENNIEILTTKYPININYDAKKEKALQKGIKFEFLNENQPVKTLYKLPFDLDGHQDERNSFLLCHRANVCIYLQNGRVYTCTVAPTARHFDRAFGTHIFSEEGNSIDIYKAKSAEEILEFLAKPIPFCRFCKVQNTKERICIN